MARHRTNREVSATSSVSSGRRSRWSSRPACRWRRRAGVRAVRQGGAKVSRTAPAKAGEIGVSTEPCSAVQSARTMPRVAASQCRNAHALVVSTRSRDGVYRIVAFGHIGAGWRAWRGGGGRKRRLVPLDRPRARRAICRLPPRRLVRSAWGHSSAGRAPEWHSGGQRFDPAWLPPETVQPVAGRPITAGIALLSVNILVQRPR